MAYKFQRGEAILSGALLQEGNVEIESGFEFAMHDVTVLDTSRNLTVAAMSGSGNLQVGGTVQLDGVADADAEATDKMYFLDADGLMKADAIEDVRDNLIFGSFSGDATIAHGGELTIAAGAVENDMLAGSIANAKLVNDSVTVTAGAALSGGGEVDLGASINLDVEVDDSSIEVSGDALQVKALGITNDMLAGSIASSKIAELNAFDTDGLSEGSSNLYFSDARARAAISVTDNGGDGSLGYDSSTGVISFTGPSADEVRAHFSTGYMIDLAAGEFSIDAAEFSGSWDAVLATKSTDDLDEGSSHLYYEDSRARAAVSVTDAGGDGSLAYDSSTGVFTYTGPSAAEVRAHLSAGEMLEVTDGEFSIVSSEFSGSWDDVLATKDTDDLAEGSNLYFTDARARAAVSVTDAGGDGSLAYDSSTGVITYTGPSAAEVRAHLSVADTNSIDMSVTDGQFSADLLISGSQLEVTADGLRLAAGAADGSTMELSDDSLSVLAVPHALSQGEGISAFSFDGSSDVTIGLDSSVAGAGLTYSSGVLAVVNATNGGLFVDADAISLSLDDLAAADIDVASDSIAYYDDSESGTRKESIADLVSAMAGEGLTATDGVLKVTGNDVHSKANGDTLQEGYNYFGSNVPAETDWSVTLPSSPAAGDVVHVKAQDIGDHAGIEIAVDGGTSHTIDGESFIILESPYAAVSLVYVASNDWRIV